MRESTKQKIKFINENKAKLSNKEIAALLGISENNVVSIIWRHGLGRNKDEVGFIVRKFKDLAIKRRKEVVGCQKGENNFNWKGGISKNHYHYKKLQVAKYPERVKARHKVHLAVKNGSLKKQPCEVCGSEFVFAHHEDYNNPLDVVWLCRPHHREKHDNRH